MSEVPGQRRDLSTPQRGQGPGRGEDELNCAHSHKSAGVGKAASGQPWETLRMLRRRSRLAWPGAPGAEGGGTELRKEISGYCQRGQETGQGWQPRDTPQRRESGLNTEMTRRGKGGEVHGARPRHAEPRPGTSGGLAAGRRPEGGPDAHREEAHGEPETPTRERARNGAAPGPAPPRSLFPAHPPGETTG